MLYRRSFPVRIPPFWVIILSSWSSPGGTSTVALLQTGSTTLLRNMQVCTSKTPNYDSVTLFATTTMPPPAKSTGFERDNDDFSSYHHQQQRREKVTFPAPLTPTERILRAATFWSTAVPLLFSYYGKYAEIALRKQILNENLSDVECEMLWDQQHETGATKLADTITSLKGFYVKTAQIIASRQDLFPKQYTEALHGFTDDLDPMSASLARAVVESELLNTDERFEDVFMEFDDIPLGSASVAQVHRAVLSPKYGGPREVAVKIQRPAIEPKLMGDIANLKAISKPLQSIDALPLDYYTVFCELEKQLADEFDFVAEASAMERIYSALTRSYPDGRQAAEVPLVIPRPISGLVSRRVLVMDYLKGVPLSRAREEMMRRGVDPNSPEAKLFGRKLLRALTEVFGRSILETGFFHADPHPGNIFVLENGSIGLIDFGQVKQISGRSRETLAKVMLALDERQSNKNPTDVAKIGSLALELGVELKDDAKDKAAAAIAMWLFDGSMETLPGGYDKGELSPNSPVKELKSFPQDLVLVGRSTILIKGLSSRLGIPWNLSHEWAPIARRVLDRNTRVNLNGGVEIVDGTVRFRRDVLGVFRRWGGGKVKNALTRLPSPVRKKVALFIVKMQERRERRKRRRQKQLHEM